MYLHDYELLLNHNTIKMPAVWVFLFLVSLSAVGLADLHSGLICLPMLESATSWFPCLETNFGLPILSNTLPTGESLFRS